MTDTPATEHLRRNDVPETLALLNALLGGREPAPAGYTRDASGAAVDWQLLTGSSLPTSDRAVVHIAHGLAILERGGGSLPLRLRDQVLAAVQTVVEVP